MHIREKDIVEVIAGNYKGKRAKVLKVNRVDGTVVVEGVNLVWKHVRKSQRNPQGGRLSREAPLPLAKVQLVCAKCGKPTRTGARLTADGAKERHCKHKTCGASLGLIGRPRESASSGG